MDNKYMTVKEYAAICGITTQAAYKKLKKKPFSDFVMRDSSGSQIVSTDILSREENPQDIALLATTLQPLATTEKQLTEALEVMQSLLTINQKLQTDLQVITDTCNQLQTTVDRLQTTVESMESEIKTANEENKKLLEQIQQQQEQKKGFFARLFGK